jgi:hypothetical protein
MAQVMKFLVKSAPELTRFVQRGVGLVRTTSGV